MASATLTLPLPELQHFLFIFLRASAILMTLPVLDSRNIPIVFKAGLALGLGLMVRPLTSLAPAPVFTDVLPFGIAIANEILVGALVGLSVKLFFTGVQMAGQLAGFQMGFAIANVFDPGASAQVSIPAQIYNLAALLMFLALDGHHLLIRAIAESFRRIPPPALQLSGERLERFLVLAGDLFVVAVKVGAPLIVALLLLNVALAIVARTVPQMNVFFVAMPVQIAVGLFFIGITLPFLLHFLKLNLKDLFRTATILLLP